MKVKKIRVSPTKDETRFVFEITNSVRGEEPQHRFVVRWAANLFLRKPHQIDNGVNPCQVLKSEILVVKNHPFLAFLYR